MEYVCNPVVDELLALAYGQRNSVALPGKKLSRLLGKGRFPAGVRDVLDYLLDEYLKWADGPGNPTHVDWAFLIGGPGNGKSQALNDLADLLSIDIPSPQQGQPAPRTVPGTWPACASECKSCVPLQIVFINDASVPRQGLPPDGPGSLFHDIRDGIERLSNPSSGPLALFGNVNRGVLIEEINKLGKVGSRQGQVAGRILRWLANPATTVGAGITTVPTTPNQPYYAQLCIPGSGYGGQLDLVVHAVFLDTVSLLEPYHDAADDKVVDFTQSPPVVAPYEPIGELCPSSLSRDQTVAGERVMSSVRQDTWKKARCGPDQCAAYNLCPFAQNAIWLRDPKLRENFLSTLRGAEIAAGRRFTYRDLVGHISLAILGRLEPSWLQGQHPCKWVHELHGEINSGVGETTGAIARLADHRIYATLFSTRDHGVWLDDIGSKVNKYPLHGALGEMAFPRSSAQRPRSWESGFESIDPARDTGEWQRGVVDSCDALHIESPVAWLLGHGELPPSACSEIETKLDECLRGELLEMLRSGDSSDTRRGRALWHWRSVQLLRHVGLATGHIAFDHVLDTWLELHRLSLHAPSREYRNDISKGLLYLVVQTSDVDGDQRLILAPLRPRTYALSRIPSDTLVVMIDPRTIQVRAVADGDSLLAEVLMRRHPYRYEPVARFPVGLAVAREAMLLARQRELGKTPFTEIAVPTFARIERTRAALVGRLKTVERDVYFLDSDGNRRLVSSSSRRGKPFEIR